jgi:hypothetical protein
MNDGYLDGDCVIKFLCNNHFLAQCDWKQGDQKSYYLARFYDKGTATITFQISD